MQGQTSPIRAAIDVGSNTIHLVIARWIGTGLDIIVDELELVRIGESVNATGAISQQKRDTTVATLNKYKALVEQYTNEPILVVATEAIRKATNRDAFLAEVKRETGLELLLIQGEVEAALTFYGATYELNRASQQPAEVAVMDLGGGSLELVIAKEQQITWHACLPIGSGLVHDRYLSANPPGYEDMDAARSFLSSYLQQIHLGSEESALASPPQLLVMTGGSANSLRRLARRAFRLSSQEARLTYDDITRCEGLLMALSSEEISQRYGQPLARARILPAGALIIRVMMERLRVNEMRVSAHGIREGLLLARERYGEEWLERIRTEMEAKPASRVS